MSCRESSQGSLATTTVGRLLGLPDAQCTSLFHQLRSRYQRAYSNMDDGTRRVEDRLRGAAYEASLASTDETVNRSGLWTARTREAAARRVRRAREDGTQEPRDQYALVSLPAAALRAREAQDAHLAFVANMRQIPLDDVVAEYARLRSEYSREMSAEAQAAPSVNSLLGAAPYVVLPNDPATRRALYILAAGERCSDCGRFMSTTGEHTCPGPDSPTGTSRRNRDGWAPLPAAGSRNAQTMPQIDAETVVGSAFNPDDHSASTATPGQDTASAGDGGAPEPAGVAADYDLDNLAQPGQCPTCGKFRGVYGHTCQTSSGGATREPDHIDNFQEVYDAARAAIANGEPVPTDEEIESIPGAVTGGLGARDGGNSFGLEIEIDFPDDTYPFRKREQFARRLYDAGIVAYPTVQGWHSVGDEGYGRPNGTYEQSSSGWVCEYDRSVDDEGGQRGVEIKSQIMFDEPETWRNLRTILEVSEELGGRATQRTGLHVNIGAHPMPHGEVEPLLRLMRTAAAYDDTLIRLGNNPDSNRGLHRGRTFCTPVTDGYVQSNSAENAISGYHTHEAHRQAVNLSHVTPVHRGRHGGSSRVEFREFDGVAKASDVGRIQAAVTLHLAMVQAAADGREPGQGTQPAGTQRRRFGRRTLTGEEWEESTLPMRHILALSDEVAPNPLLRRQLVHMFTASRWQSA